jgi:hypothetical protein
MLGLSLYATCGAGAPLAPEEKVTLQLPGFRQTARFVAFRAGERALVLGSGNGQSPLALYVYDPDGNCVAKDDIIEPRASSDDVAVELYPPATARYTIEIRNVGFGTSVVQLIAR